jgi:hypothetical protein
VCGRGSTCTLSQRADFLSVRVLDTNAFLALYHDDVIVGVSKIFYLRTSHPSAFRPRCHRMITMTWMTCEKTRKLIAERDDVRRHSFCIRMSEWNVFRLRRTLGMACLQLFASPFLKWWNFLRSDLAFIISHFAQVLAFADRPRPPLIAVTLVHSTGRQPQRKEGTP